MRAMKLVLASLLFVLGCGGSNNGNPNCTPLSGGVACFYPATMAAARTRCGDVTE